MTCWTVIDTKKYNILAISLSNFHEPALSNVVSELLYTYFFLSLSFTMLVAPNKQFLNLRLLVGYFGQVPKLCTM